MKRSITKAIKELQKKVNAKREAAAKEESAKRNKIVKDYNKAIKSYNEVIDGLKEAGLSIKKEVAYSILKEAGENDVIKAIEDFENMKKIETIENLINKQDKTKEELLTLLSKKNRTLVLKSLHIAKNDWVAWNKFKKSILIDLKYFQNEKKVYSKTDGMGQKEFEEKWTKEIELAKGVPIVEDSILDEMKRNVKE